MKTTELTYSRSTKINKGNYEQDAPMFCQKVVIEGECDPKEEYARLRQVVDSEVEDYVKEAKIVIPEHFRIREKNGKRYPSVTTIINPEPLSKKIPNLEKYGLRGRVLEEVLTEYLALGKWIEPVGDISPLKWDDIPYKKFIEKFGKRIKYDSGEMGDTDVREVFNDEFMYSGEIDLLCWVDDELTIADVKTGKFRATYWEQLCAYLYAFQNDPKKVERWGMPTRIAIFDLKDCELRITGSVKPLHKFLVKRGEFKGRFSI